MKKFLLTILISSVFTASNLAFADTFDSLENLTPSQKQRISLVYNSYKIKNNELEDRIAAYNDKIAQIKADKDKTMDQISLLTATYERNIETLKNQQDYLTKETEEQYKKILTEKQFQQYQALQIQVQDSFKKFLQF